MAPKSQNEANYRGGRPMTTLEADRANRAMPARAPVRSPKKASSVPLQCRPPRSTAETVIGALEDADHYQAFEAAIVADYDAQSAVMREPVLRLASLLWRLARTNDPAFEMQADRLRERMSEHASRSLLGDGFGSGSHRGGQGLQRLSPERPPAPADREADAPLYGPLSQRTHRFWIRMASSTSWTVRLARS